MVFAGWGDMGLGSLQAGVGTALDAFRQQSAQDQLTQLGQQLQSGDYAGAAGLAFKTGKLDTGLALMKLDQQQKALNAPPDPALSQFIGPVTSAGSVTPAPVGGFDNAFKRTVGFEGTGPATIDNNGAPVKFGVNQAANPNVDVANLNLDQAKNIYKKNYWDALGLDNIEPRLAHVIFDTAVHSGQAKAQEIMDASGGDANKALALRQGFLGKLVASGDEKYAPYADNWNTRIQNLRADVNAPGGGRVVASDEEGPDNTEQINTLRNRSHGILNAVQRLGAQESVNPNAKSSKEVLLKEYDSLQKQIDKLGKQPDVKPFTDADYQRFGINPAIDGKYYYADSKPTSIGAKKTGGDYKSIPQGGVVVGPDPENPGKIKELYRNGPSPSSVDPDVVNGYVERYLKGDQSVFTALPRNSPTRQAVSDELARRQVEDPNLSDTMLKNRAIAKGMGSQAQTSGRIQATTGYYADTAARAANMALQAAALVPRTSYPAVNQAIQTGKVQTGDPDVARFITANTTFAQEYAKAINPTGVARVEDIKRGLQNLSTADGPEAYAAKVNQMIREMQIAHEVGQHWRSRIGGDSPFTETAVPPIGTEPPPTPGVGSQSSSVPDVIGGLFGMRPNNPPPTTFKPIDLGGGVTMRQVR